MKYKLNEVVFTERGCALAVWFYFESQTGSLNVGAMRFHTEEERHAGSSMTGTVIHPSPLGLFHVRGSRQRTARWL